MTVGAELAIQQPPFVPAVTESLHTDLPYRHYLSPFRRYVLCHDVFVAKLFRVLRLTVTKRPVLFADFNQTNQHVLPAQAKTLVQSVRDYFVKGTLLVDGSPGVECDLDKHAIF
jgi:hypothetical protein